MLCRILSYLVFAVALYQAGHGCVAAGGIAGGHKGQYCRTKWMEEAEQMCTKQSLPQKYVKGSVAGIVVIWLFSTKGLQIVKASSY